MTLAVGFSPRITVESNLRRVATIETTARQNQPSLRDAGVYCDRIRGLKPTAKVIRHYAPPKYQMTNSLFTSSQGTKQQ
jgi:hypothetical protein